MLMLTESWLGKEDVTLTNKLLTEAPSIFNWALDGLDRLTERGHFEMPKASQEAVLQLEDLASPVAAFLRERCKIDPAMSVEVDVLWDAWKVWCEGQGRGPGTKNGLGSDLRAAVPSLRKERPRVDGGRMSTYSGIRLLKAKEVNDDEPNRDEHDDEPDIRKEVVTTTVTTEVDPV